MPLLISVQDFGFRGWPVSLLFAALPQLDKSHLSRFSRRSLRLALQSKAGTGYNKKLYRANGLALPESLLGAFY
jgi:hypothetical protein